jgi:hypothetical protein
MHRLRLVIIALILAIAGSFVVVAPAQASAPVILSGSSWYGGGGVNVCGGSTDPSCGSEAHVGGVSSNWWQCVELAQRFYQAKGWHSGSFGASYAYQIYNIATNIGMTKQANGSITSVIPGDMIIHASSDPGSQGAGHVSIVDSVSGSTVNVVEQNGPTSNGRATYTLSGGSLSRGSAPILGVVHDPANVNQGSSQGVTRDVNAYGFADLVIAGTGPTGSGVLEAHVLSGASNFGTWFSHWPTAAGYLNANDRLVMGDVNGDGRSDLVVVGIGPTGSGKLEVHALSGATGFSTWVGHWVTAAGYLGANDRLGMADVNHDDRADLVIMATGPTGSGKLEAHVLNGATGFGSWLGNWATISGYSGAADRQLVGDVNGDGRADLLVIGVGPSTSSGKIEVHAMSGATNYSSWLGHWTTPADYLNANDRLVMGDVNSDGKSDLVIVGTGPTGSGKVEVHALSGATNYSTWLGHWVSASNYTGSTDVIVMGG